MKEEPYVGHGFFEGELAEHAWWCWEETCWYYEGGAASDEGEELDRDFWEGLENRWMWWADKDWTLNILEQGRSQQTSDAEYLEKRRLEKDGLRIHKQLLTELGTAGPVDWDAAIRVQELRVEETRKEVDDGYREVREWLLRRTDPRSEDEPHFFMLWYETAFDDVETAPPPRLYLEAEDEAQEWLREQRERIANREGEVVEEQFRLRVLENLRGDVAWGKVVFENQEDEPSESLIVKEYATKLDNYLSRRPQRKGQTKVWLSALAYLILEKKKEVIDPKAYHFPMADRMKARHYTEHVEVHTDRGKLWADTEMRAKRMEKSVKRWLEGANIPFPQTTTQWKTFALAIVEVIGQMDWSEFFNWYHTEIRRDKAGQSRT